MRIIKRLSIRQINDLWTAPASPSDGSGRPVKEGIGAVHILCHTVSITFVIFLKHPLQPFLYPWRNFQRGTESGEGWRLKKGRWVDDITLLKFAVCLFLCKVTK